MQHTEEQFDPPTEDDYLEFLDRVRESGETNMYGAGPYLQAEFGLTREDAREVLKKWMDTFSERHGIGE